MAINKKLIHFKTKQKFNEELAKGNILNTSIIFIQDTKEIYTHGTYYDGSKLDIDDLKEKISKIKKQTPPIDCPKFSLIIYIKENYVL